MLSLIKKALDGLGYPIRKQGSLLADEPYPDSFFTVWNDNTNGTSYYDDTDNAIVWDYSLNFYSIDPHLVNTVLLEAKNLLKAEGFIVDGVGYDVMSDEPTHTGRGITITYKQII